MSAPEGYIPGFVCTLDTCSVKEWGFVHYRPTIAGNALFLAIMAVIAVYQIYLGIRLKTKSFMIAICLGLLTEIAGYVARVLLNGNPFSRDYFLWYLITLTIGPVFIAAAIYLTLGRIVVVHGAFISRIKPRTYTTFFLGCDIVSLVVQAVGGGIAASTPLDNPHMIDVGTNILVAGLSIQVASLFAFSACSLEFLWRVRKNPEMRNPEFADLVSSKRFNMFLIALFGATACLFVRTVFRSVELSEGFSGELANQEVEFMVLDGVMIILACLCLSIWHPGHGFGGRWNEAKFRFRNSKNKVDQEEVAEAVAPRRHEKGELETSAERL
ncbi:RTA1 like protein [Colletotrichum graminicola]|uniref:RTA1 like protein n=1 Tax=Colletotrichum graminicola (strain M1.001 / M2 / FGSC 10212) TaxID=645133 RepID=E3QIF9_COLGM|nr:RTA1 like protein [Colletotrichum graminicola M1.001]EFQ30569.1 RTA1 like protein [Colletotrichum graminicola M1.001]WDK21276.1 RTA1 like protein [Colletotrichum graminicola]